MPVSTPRDQSFTFWKPFDTRSSTTTCVGASTPLPALWKRRSQA
jgi:hypothetical protein